MMADEFDQLRAAWTAQTVSDAELAVNRRLWRRGLWKMRLKNAADVLLLALIAWTSIEAVVRGSWITSVLSILVLIGLGLMQWQAIRFRKLELGAVAVDTIGALESARSRLRARLTRNSLTLAAMVPGTIIGIAAGRARKADGIAPVLAGRPDWAVPYIQAIGIALMVAIVAWVVSAVLRDRRALAILGARIEAQKAERVADVKAAC